MTLPRRAAITTAALLAAACGGTTAARCPTVTPSDLANCTSLCEAGDAEVCARIGVAYEAAALGEGPDMENARRFFARACQHAGDDERWVCVLEASVDEEPDDESIATLQRLCADGVLLACHELARPRSVTATVPMDLPSVAEPGAPTVTVAIAADEALYLDGAPTTLEALAGMEVAPGTRAVIAADRAVAHQRFIAVVDALRGAGIERYAIHVAPDDLEAPPVEPPPAD